MATPAEGAYLIISVGSSKALDVVGESDKAKANVIQYTANHSDGQIWTLAKTSAGWQITCVLSGKVLAVNAGSNGPSAGTNVFQYSDTNKDAQRWTIASVSGTYTYKGTAYPKYTIKSKLKSLAMGVKSNSSSNNANIEVQNSSSSTYQQWILVPVSVLKTDGTYRIALAAAPKMCIGVSGKSTANNANVEVVAYNEDDLSQVWRADVNEETSIVRFVNALSGKYMDVKGGTASNGANVIQNKKTNGTSQTFLPEQLGTMKDMNKNKIPSYEIHSSLGNNFYLDCKGGGKKAKTNIQLYTRNKKVSQRFGFVPSEILGKKLSAPGAIRETLFTCAEGGSITVSGLSFASGQTYFQARYLVRKYHDIACTKYNDSKWMNIKSNSTARDGWCAIGSYDISNANPSVKGIASLSIPSKTRKFTLKKSQTAPVAPTKPRQSRTDDPDGWAAYDAAVTTYNTQMTTYKNQAVAVDLIIEVRTFSKNYSGGFTAHSNARRTTVKLRQKPTVNLKSISLYVGGNSVGITTQLTNSLNTPVKWMRARVVGDDDIPIGDWSSVSSMTMNHVLGKKLYRLPRNNENLTVEYQILLQDGIQQNGTFTKTFVYDSVAPTIDISKTYYDDGSGRVQIDAAYHESDCCVMEVVDIDGSKFVKIPFQSHSDNVASWVLDPPLNKTVNVYIYGKNASTDYVYGETTVLAESLASIWTWKESDTYNYATLLANNDGPLSQTRTFSNGLNLQSPAGRYWQVGFSGITVSGDLSVSGVIVDPDANYQTAGPLPGHLGISYISALVRLAGKGIHPIYRTPYGDRYQVAVQSVDVSKNELYYTDVSVTQNIVED